jgi:hypothetical protein
VERIRVGRVAPGSARWAIALAACLCAAAPLRAQTPREQVEARRTTNPQVVVDVITGERLTGAIERTTDTDFYLADESGLDRILVPYFAVRALTDPDTGERIPFDPPAGPPEKSAPPDRPPAPATTEERLPPGQESSGVPVALWVAGAAIGGALILWVAMSRSKRS